MNDTLNPYNVCWIGNAGWLLQIGQIKLLIDPDLDPSPERKSLAGIPEDCLKNADAVLITHEHGDHFNVYTVKRLINESSCRFVLPASCMSAAMQAGIPADRIIAAHHGRAVALFGEDFRVTPVPAIHGGCQGAVYRHYNPADCGYLISAGGLRLFHPGDSVLLEEHLALKQVDILMISPTEHNTHIQSSLTLIRRLAPRYIFPQHRDTYYENESNYFWTCGYHNELMDELDEDSRSRYHVLAQGQVFVVSK